jgi:hypothetical protein
MFTTRLNAAFTGSFINWSLTIHSLLREQRKTMSKPIAGLE